MTDPASPAGRDESSPDDPSPSSAPPVPGSPDPPAAGEVEQAVFGAALPAAEHYVQLLAEAGVAHGHIGPREVPRLWSRHVLNSAAVTELIPPSARVIDVGSGAGLPGVPIALRRPDVSVVLVEPMQRRVDFLQRVVDETSLADRVTVVRGRAEDRHVRDQVGTAVIVTARAVARLDRLVRWCLPLLAPDGRLLAMKGQSAPDEVAEVESTLQRLGAADVAVHELAVAPGVEPTWVVSLRRAAGRGQRRRGR